MTNTLPNPGSPTSRSSIYPSMEGHRPNINVFGVMPVRRLGDVETGDTVQLNLASYIDPGWEGDAHRIAWGTPRWMQGLLVTVNALERVYSTPPPRYVSRYSGVYPADRVFNGQVANHDSGLAVEGVLHPNKAGWLAFDADAFGDRTLKTMADLKAEIGQISREDADAINKALHRTLTFKHRNGREYS
jgi:hypothetical protein